jgi:fructokinase
MRIGVDLGGTKIEALALDDLGKERLRRRVPTPAHSADAIVAAIAELVRAFERELGERAHVGVATPGAISPATGLMKNSNTTCLNGTRLDRLLEAALERPLRMANDANCFALSEAVDGAAAGASVVFGVILGTGTGGGVVVDGRVLTGRHAIAGEWGHNPLPWPEPDEVGRACYCGKRGCLETWLSGPAMAIDHRERTGDTLDPPAIAALAVSGREDARVTIARYRTRLGKALATVVNVIDPDVIVLGGGMSNIEALYEPALAEALAEHAFGDGVSTKVVRAKHGDSSGVRGAAWLWGRS